MMNECRVVTSIVPALRQQVQFHKLIVVSVLNCRCRRTCSAAVVSRMHAGASWKRPNHYDYVGENTEYNFCSI